MINEIKKLLSNREIVLYLVFGVLTTVVNFIVYGIATRIFSIDELISNMFAWLFAVVFAYITNKLFVFSSKTWDKKTLIKESLSFFSARIFSLAVDTMIMFLGIKIFLLYDLYVKLFSQIVIVILNYVLSKYFVFNKSK